MYLKCEVARHCSTCGALTHNLYRRDDCYACMLLRTKICSTCNIRQDVTEYYADKRRPGGLKSQCKTCHCATSIRTRDEDKKRDANRIHMRRAREASPEKFRNREREASARRVKDARTTARMLLNNAVRNGRIIKPDTCERCSVQGRVTAHHPDYDKPLEVAWLCYTCHGKEHRNE